MSSGFFTAFGVELKKNRHRLFFMLPGGFLLVLMLWSGYSNHNLSPERQAQGYQAMLYELPVLNCILMPMYLAVIASRLCDMERKGDTLKLLCTLEEKHQFYDCKYIHEFIYLFLFAVGEGLLLPLFGRWYGYTDTLSLQLWLLHVICLLVSGASVLTLQHISSLLAKNQMFPLFLGLAGSFIGLFTLFFPNSIGRLILWSYFGQFLPYRMDYDPVTRVTVFSPLPFPVRVFVLFSLFTAVFYAACRQLFLKKEV